MEEYLVDYTKEEDKALYTSIFMCREELIDAWKVSKSYSKHCMLNNPVDLEQVKPKFEGSNMSKGKVQVII
jgi:hypothetical protein